MTTERARCWLDSLCDLPGRRVGSPGNRAATRFFAEQAAACGFRVETPEFACIDWIRGEAVVRVGSDSFIAQVSPYSLGCRVKGELVAVSDPADLQAADLTGRVALLHGAIAKEQLMPKRFPFYNPAEHQQIIALLEAKQPAAIISATGRNPELAGGVYPFPLIEDGDFDIPSVFMTEEEGIRLATRTGASVSVKIDAHRIPATGHNVIARKGPIAGPRVVICAHIDAKDDTPGALDNASGVVVLLLLAELLRDYDGELGVELLAFNGEDYYSAPGQVQYLQDNQAGFSDILLAINIDLACFREGATVFSLYGCPAEVAPVIRTCLSARPGFAEGEQWYQSDHSVFIQNGRPAVAITSERFMWLSTYVTHTAKDRPELVDVDRLLECAAALFELMGALPAHSGLPA